VRLPRVSPTAVRNVALATMILYSLLMLSGAGVRLTGSGLGCPDWPTCYQHRLTAVASFHPMVEFVNRLVTVALSVISILALVLAWLRTPRRRDLVWLAVAIMGGLVGQIVVGGVVVLTKLNPYLVSLHFLLTVVIIAVAVAFFHRARQHEDEVELHARPLVGRDLIWLGRLLVAALGLVTVIGTLVTGAGPHAGSPSTPGSPIRRVAIAFRDIAAVHTDAALFLIGLTLASLFAFHHADAPPEVQRHLRILFEVLVFQGAIGYAQYFFHDAPGLVEVHVAGATVLWLTALAFYLALHEHAPIPGGFARKQEVAAVGRSSP
jgi:heme a synthase